MPGWDQGGLEATTGFEPVNRGFADPRVEPLHHVAPTGCAASRGGAGCPSRIRTSVHGSKVRCPTTRRRGSGAFGEDTGAEDGTRTRDPHLGKVMLYQLSHFRSMSPTLEEWCRGPGSNWRHRDFQSRALPTELPRLDGQPHWLSVGGAQDTTGLRRDATTGALLQAGELRLFGVAQRRFSCQLPQPVHAVDDRRMGRHQVR